MEEAAVSEETLKREERLLRSVCSFQSRLGPPEYRRWRRIHGLQFPLHPMQVAGWLVFVGVGAATFLVMVPAIGGAAQQSLAVVLATLFLLHVVSHITALLLDPADPELRVLKVKMAVPEFDRSKHSHVIENGRCHLCNIRTNTPRTKHCSVCNKCVDHFDHHCKWLNHCVGGRNYVAFIVCVVSAVLASLVVVALAVAELTFYHLDPTWLDVSHPDPVFLVIVSALGITGIVTAGLLLHLCLFHCYISILGITTYEYIRNYRLGRPNKCPGLKETCCRWRTNPRNTGRTLKRQNTDPDFIDRVVKPFSDGDKAQQAEPVFTLREFLRLCPKQLTLDISRRGSLPNGKFKNNQVRPTTEEELNRTLDKIAEAAQTSTTLPILGPRLTHKVHLQELRSALDLAECGPIRHARRGFKPHPHTPSLSPIRESGLSNPNSPRLTATSRPTTPQVSTIFLSNPSSPCLSNEEEDTITAVSYRSRPMPEDILQTPQMPRKSYSPTQVFVATQPPIHHPEFNNLISIAIKLPVNLAFVVNRLAGEMEAWERLGKPRLVVAPMVDASELAWRVLSRRHGAQLCYTPMFHSSVFVRDLRYRAEALASCPEDRPLVIQFCGHDADTLVKAALLAQDHADVIDINLGCPQAIAKRGRYGAFLQDDWPLLTEIVGKLNKSLTIPVSCKIRIYPGVEKTVEYAKMLEKAGARILTVHGRTKEQKGPLTGLASWSHIQAVKESVSIPVFANGNIQCIQDLERCLKITGCDAAMSAEGNLYNPAIFEGIYPPAWEMALEYLDLIEQYPCPISYTRGHLFKIFHHLLCLPENSEQRTALAGRGTVEDFRKVVILLRGKYVDFHEGVTPWTDGCTGSYDLVLPPWLCRPYERPPIEEINGNDVDGVVAKKPKSEKNHELSKSRKKKVQKRLKEAMGERRILDLCSKETCQNPAGLKCEKRLCKICCKALCHELELDCVGHGILTKTRRETARMYEKEAKNITITV